MRHTCPILNPSTQGKKPIFLSYMENTCPHIKCIYISTYIPSRQEKYTCEPVCRMYLLSYMRHSCDLDKGIYIGL